MFDTCSSLAHSSGIPWMKDEQNYIFWFSEAMANNIFKGFPPKGAGVANGILSKIVDVVKAKCSR